MNLDHNLNLAIKAAVEAGEILIKNYSEEKNFQLKSKRNRELYTKVDLESEKKILDTLSKNRRNKINYLFEENGYVKKFSNSKYSWIIDALDGTVNYIHKFPFFCTSIALMYENNFKIGVIYNPVLKELYYSTDKYGVFKNSMKIKIDSNVISKSLVAVSLSSDYKKKGELDAFKKINIISQGVLRTGSAGMNLAYFSEGRFSACVGFRNKIWDVAAGLALATKQGAKVFCRYKNKKKNSISFIVANKNNFDDLYKICKNCI